MATTTSRARQAGYVVAALVNVGLAWLVNVWPGWEAVPFLTADAAEVIPLLNASLAVGAVSNLVYLLYDPPWLRALGSVATAGLSVAVLARTLAVFPFDFGDDASTWEPIAEVGLIFLVVASGLALIVQVAQFVKLLVLGPGREDDEEWASADTGEDWR